MKRLAITAFAAALALCMLGCSDQGNESANGDNDVGAAAEPKSQVEVVRGYVTDPAVVDVMENMNDRFSGVIDSMVIGDYEDVDRVCAEAIKACDKVLELEGVPEQAKSVHEKVCDIAETYSNAFFCFEVASGSMQTGDTEEANSKIDEGNKYYGEIAGKLDDVSALIDTYI